ncbi:MAG: hypothetical protein AAGJ37_05925 [Pseudomonadota bacterium]
MLVACQPPSSEQPQQPTTTDEAPLLTLSELLAASDIQDALSDAAREKDKDAFRDIQTLLLQAASEVGLDDSEQALISGENGVIFLEFQGMRINFNHDFQKAFFSFGDIQAVYQKYPAFEELKARTEALVENRDKLIDAIKADLEADGIDTSSSLDEARKLWLQLMREQGLDEIAL